MKVIYIAGPFRGENAWTVERNIRRAEELAFRVARAGAMPLCPHTNTRFFNGTLTEQFWLDGTVELLLRCDAIALTHNWHASRGARDEHEVAWANGLRVFYDEGTTNIERDIAAWLLGAAREQVEA